MTEELAEGSQLELERRIFHLKTLNDVSQVIGALRDPQPILKNLSMMVMGTFGVRRGAAFLFGSGESTVKIVVQRGIAMDLATMLDPLQNSEGWPASLQIGEVVTLNPGTMGDPVSQALASCQLQLWIPFVVNDLHYGGIALGEKLSGEVYSADDCELLGTIVNQLIVALDNALAYREIEELNRGLEEKVRQRTEELRVQHTRLQEAHGQLELRNRFIESAFGRYVSDEVVSSLLESPEGLQLGGEKRKTTILMSDLRGFTALAEKLSPEQVLTIVNRYLGTMTDIILRHQGTINEFIGDAILVLFGAPVTRDDDAQRAVACAVAMQQAMATVNAQNRHERLPEVEMGIGIHTGEVVVGNIGSQRRMKYGIVGSPANLTSRVESYTVGGQILISEATWAEGSALLHVARRFQVEAKGIERPLVLYDVRGIAGEYNLFLSEHREELVSLVHAVEVRYSVIEGKHLGDTEFAGRCLKLSLTAGEIASDRSVPLMSNLRLQLLGGDGQALLSHLYGKVMEHLSEEMGFVVRFSAALPEELLYMLLGREPSSLLDSQLPVSGD